MPARRTFVAAASVASALAAAGPADAATIATPPCIPFEAGASNLPIATTGFTPGSLVTVATSPKGSTTFTALTSGTADAAGNFATTSLAPSFNPFTRKLQTFNIAASDNVNPANIATSTFQQVRPGYDFNPSSGRPTRTVTHTARGFAPGKTVYLHLRFDGRNIRTVSLGKASAPCGVATKRLALLPARARRGLWRYFVDQKKTYSANTRPQARSGLRITLTFG